MLLRFFDAARPAFNSAGSGKHASWRRNNILHAMNDLIYLGITFAFFIVSALYVRFCEQL
ncbi:MAG: hypothetical protein NTY98_09575 [Verrucomicrobia bacterium]|nr:hypothetical protein [Verrucomicrobiota bacterium]